MQENNPNSKKKNNTTLMKNNLKIRTEKELSDFVTQGTKLFTSSKIQHSNVCCEVFIIRVNGQEF